MKPLYTQLALFASTMPKSSRTRDFILVPYGAPVPVVDDPQGNRRPTISCDGRIEGVQLELTHWTGNQTPDHLYADTSTEIALNFAKQEKQVHQLDAAVATTFDNALVLNNHYDTDGVLSVWACLEPDRALQYEKLLIEGAAAGDFGEWTSEAGLKLNFAIENIAQQQEGGGSDEQLLYQEALGMLPALLEDIQNNGGNNFAHMWKEDFEEAQRSYANFEAGKIRLCRGPGRLVLVEQQEEEEQQDQSSSRSSHPVLVNNHALHRALVEADLWKDTTRLLLYNNNDHAPQQQQRQYRYQMTGHGWVQKLVDRPEIPPVENVQRLVQNLNEALPQAVWIRADDGGLTSICRTTAPQGASTPEQVAALLHSLDAGAQE